MGGDSCIPQIDPSFSREETFAVRKEGAGFGVFWRHKREEANKLSLNESVSSQRRKGFTGP